MNLGKHKSVAFVKAKNLDRRMLNESQRAMVAARVANLRHGSNQHKRAGYGGKEEGEISPPSVSRDAAAKLFGVDKTNVTRCKQILEKGIPELAPAVCDGPGPERGRGAGGRPTAPGVVPRVYPPAPVPRPLPSVPRASRVTAPPAAAPAVRHRPT